MSSLDRYAASRFLLREHLPLLFCNQFSQGMYVLVPCLLASAVLLQYWIVRVDPLLQWAIVSGGPPEEPSNGFCSTGTGTIGTNNVGIWLYHKDPQPPAQIVQEILDKAADLGFDVSLLVKVNHTACMYG